MGPSRGVALTRSACSLLKPGGTAVIHTITSADNVRAARSDRHAAGCPLFSTRHRRPDMIPVVDNIVLSRTGRSEGRNGARHIAGVLGV
jgi:hypothetical protein